MFWKADSALTALRMNIIYLNNGVNHDSFASSTVNSSAEKRSRISSSAPQIDQLTMYLSEAELVLFTSSSNEHRRNKLLPFRENTERRRDLARSS